MSVGSGYKELRLNPTKERDLVAIAHYNYNQAGRHKRISFEWVSVCFDAALSW